MCGKTFLLTVGAEPGRPMTALPLPARAARPAARPAAPPAPPSAGTAPTGKVRPPASLAATEATGEWKPPAAVPAPASGGRTTPATESAGPNPTPASERIPAARRAAEAPELPPDVPRMLGGY
jgi:hypothetical protein